METGKTRRFTTDLPQRDRVRLSVTKKARRTVNTPVETPVVAHTAISRLIEEWQKAKDVASVVLTAAKQRMVIAEVVIDDGSYLRFQEMTTEERAHLATVTGRPTKK